LFGQIFTSRMPLLTATSVFRFGRRRYSFPHWRYMHRLRCVCKRIL